MIQNNFWCFWFFWQLNRSLSLRVFRWIFFFLKEFFSDCFWSCTPQREWNILGILPYSSHVMYFWHIKCLKKAIWFDRINYLITFFTNKCHFVVQCRDDFFFQICTKISNTIQQKMLICSSLGYSFVNISLYLMLFECLRSFTTYICSFIYQELVVIYQKNHQNQKTGYTEQDIFSSDFAVRICNFWVLTEKKKLSLDFLNAARSHI